MGCADSLPLGMNRRIICGPGTSRRQLALNHQGESMKLVRFGPSGREKPGILDSKGRICDFFFQAEDSIRDEHMDAVRPTATKCVPRTTDNVRRTRPELNLVSD